MEISKPNNYGVLEPGERVTVARNGRFYAAVRVALCEGKLYRHGVDMMYSHGGFSGPVSLSGPAFATLAAAIEAGLDELLRRWPTPFPSEPKSIHDELSDMRRQIEARLRQPSFL